MPKNECRRESFLKSPDKLPAVYPASIITKQPSVSMVLLEILFDVILICSPDEGAVFDQVDLQDTQTWSMSRAVIKSQTRGKIELRVVECLPIQTPIEIEIFATKTC